MVSIQTKILGSTYSCHSLVSKYLKYSSNPILIVNNESDSCGVVPVPENQLPVELPEDTRINSLADLPDWYTTTCPS